MSSILTRAITIALFSSVASSASASETSSHGSGHGSSHGDGHASYGKPGKASAASRTITITMKDNFFEPEDLEIAHGETIRFVIKNEGDLVHEFNIGTAETHENHAPTMQMMVDHGVLATDKINHDVAKSMQASMGHGMHDEPNSILLEPGKSGEIVWTFPDGGEIEIACNVPGHYDGGMVIEAEFKGTH
ncbi:MAG: cupredoxin domain-containing protein [Paracoccaceae bacterium]|nr:cupredoxin domain-containing protein [Paracoccaceae bacterium]